MGASPSDDLQARLAAVWRGVEGTTLGRVAAIEAAAATLATRALTDAEREVVQRESHQLRGILGTFGFHEGSRLAIEIDQLLRAGRDLDAADGRAIAEKAAALRQAIA